MRKTLIVLATALCLGLVGCAHYGALAQLPPVDHADAAELVIIRKSSLFGMGAGTIVMLDGIEVLSLGSNTYTSIRIKAGDCTIAAKAGYLPVSADGVLRLSLKADDKRYLLLTPSMASVSIREISSEEGEEMLKNSKLSPR